MLKCKAVFAEKCQPAIGPSARVSELYAPQQCCCSGSQYSGTVSADINSIQILIGCICVCQQEYGTGRFNKKHSTFFATMMRELGLNEEPEFYFDLVPWQSLASINHNFLLTERRRHYLRYAGGLTFFEVCCLRTLFALYKTILLTPVIERTQTQTACWKLGHTAVAKWRHAAQAWVCSSALQALQAAATTSLQPPAMQDDPCSSTVALGSSVSCQLLHIKWFASISCIRTFVCL